MKTCKYLPFSIVLIGLFLPGCQNKKLAEKIDREAIVSRNDIVYTKPELQGPVSVGNGKFAFTVDPTGLQTFPEAYNQLFVLGTMADYGWHSTPGPREYKIEETYKEFDSHGRKVLYPHAIDTLGSVWTKPARWLYENPHRMGLGNIGLVLTKSDGSAPAITDLTNIKQHLELWTGCLTSNFELEGKPVKVMTVVHPLHDMISVRVESPLVKEKRIGMKIAFAYANNAWGESPEDWDNPDKHTTTIISQTDTRVDFSRKLDNENSDLDDYKCSVTFQSGTAIEKGQEHHYVFMPDNPSERFEFAVTFAHDAIPGELPAFTETLDAVADHWKNYWSEGGFIDLSESKDPRWKELERRIILSQYVMAVNNVSNLPPQETGLVQKSWFGKFHMEMVWCHEAHFAFWGRIPLMNRCMGFYKELLPSSRERARFQGYKGARWPKMIGPDGREAPNHINPFLVWQQPHPIYFAELNYRENATKETLENWWEIVRETADFMASFVVKDEQTGIYDVGPPLNDVHEDSEIGQTKNMPYEVAYFRYGLNLARKWRERMGLEPDPLWDDIVIHLAPLEIQDGKYKNTPMVQWGTLPLPEGTDTNILQNTVEPAVKRLRDGSCSWGYFVTAMAAARSGRPDLAVEALLFPAKNTSVSTAGYNYWCTLVPVYLPGNGAFLSAVAMMAGGWDGSPERNAPGFPDDGKWVIKSEGLRPLP